MIRLGVSAYQRPPTRPRATGVVLNEWWGRTVANNCSTIALPAESAGLHPYVEVRTVLKNHDLMGALLLYSALVFNFYMHNTEGFQLVTAIILLTLIFAVFGNQGKHKD